MNSFLNPQEVATLKELVQVASEGGYTLWVVGGVVRDALLGYQQRLADIDLVVEGNAVECAKKVANHFSVESTEHPAFLTAKLKGLPAIEELDLASIRIETYAQPGALPLTELASSIKEDSFRRDFTVNALYLRLSDFLENNAENYRAKIYDQVGGLFDLDNRIVRVLHDKSFEDDPTRLFRAVRYREKIKGTFEKTTAELFEEALAKNYLNTISPTRQLNELEKFCSEDIWQELVCASIEATLLERVGLLDSDKRDDLCAVVRSLPRAESKARRFEMLLQLLACFTPTASREERFRAFGFGKKFFKKHSLPYDLISEPEVLITRVLDVVGYSE